MKFRERIGLEKVPSSQLTTTCVLWVTITSLAPQPLRIAAALKISDSPNIIVIVSLILLAYLIVMPLFEMITTTFKVMQADVRQIPGSEAGDFTLYYWNRLFFSKISKSLLYGPLINSLMIGLSVSVISITFGSCIAWLMVRTDLPYKKFLSMAVIIPYMLPSWCKSLAWMTVFKNERIGGSQGFLASMGIMTPDWLAYGPVAIILVLSLHYYAYSYLLVSAALRSINSEIRP